MKIIFFLITVSLFVLAASATTCSRKQFDSFKSQFNKVYTNQAEEDARFAIFCSNLEHINKKIKSEKAGGARWGITKFTDFTQEEFKKKFLGYKKISDLTKIKNSTARVPDVSAPTSFDWRDKSGVLTGVYNQGQCGSCWAFSAVENIESQWALAGNGLYSMSPQQVVDCDNNEGGCNGGDTISAYQYIQQQGGLDSWQSYPYTARNGRCDFQPSGVIAQVTGWEYCGEGDESQMVNWLVQYGPISICVDASSWNGYNGGVMSAAQCGDNVDHCVLIVGYNMGGDTPYWIVRNSWGTDWGVEGGFIYLQYGQNTCDLSSEPTSAQV